MNIYTIYKATNKINNKSYIGFTQEFKERIIGHKRDSEKYNKDSSYRTFYAAIQKYGWENFTWEILYQSKELDHTKNEMENYFIEEYRTFLGYKDCKGYNMTLGGDGSHGRECNEQTRKKISNSLSKHYESDENKERLSILTKEAMKNLSEESKQNIRNGSIGKITVKDVNTGEMFGKVDKTDSRVISGELVHNLVGVKFSEDTRKRMSKSKIGKNPYQRTEETNKRVSLGRIGKATGEQNSMSKQENRDKVSASKIGRKKYINIETNERKYCLPGNEPTGFVLITSIKK